MKTKNPEARNAWEERRQKEAELIEQTKEKLAKEYHLERNAKFERAWDIAWDWGHSNGFTEVECYFAELVDLLRP
jgi:hypothetical protein